MEKAKKTKTIKKETKKAFSIPEYDMEGKKVRDVEISESIVSMTKNDALLTQYVRVYQTNQRQGNASAKTRGEVIGSTKKIYRQKGTGNARHGSKKANLFRGGGVTFGPRPRDFELKINKKQKKQALFIALGMKYSDEALLALESKAMDMKPKTQIVLKFLQTALKGQKDTLFVLPKVEKSGFVLSTRNLENADITGALTLNAFDVLKHKNIIFVGNAAEVLSNHFEKQP